MTHQHVDGLRIRLASHEQIAQLRDLDADIPQIFDDRQRLGVETFRAFRELRIECVALGLPLGVRLQRPKELLGRGLMTLHRRPSCRRSL
ncbi:hypothetical protein SD81_038910 [Tolypothrix campylonemoides VB511288]|nr:hypothetical protein SD81_038910 [Tolypothrix campylonemoides VB511288]